MVPRLRGCQRKSSVTSKAVSLEIFGSDTLSPRSIASGRIVLGFALLRCLSFPANEKQRIIKKSNKLMAEVHNFTNILTKLSIQIGRYQIS